MHVARGEEERSALVSLLLKALIPMWRLYSHGFGPHGSTFTTLPKLNCLPKAPPENTIPFGVMNMNLALGDRSTNIQSITTVSTFSSL